MIDDDATTGSASAPQPCYIGQFPFRLPHRAETTQLRPCGHWACNPHTITYYGSGLPDDIREGDYCMICYELALPGMCPDTVLRAAVRSVAEADE